MAERQGDCIIITGPWFGFVHFLRPQEHEPWPQLCVIGGRLVESALASVFTRQTGALVPAASAQTGQPTVPPGLQAILPPVSHRHPTDCLSSGPGERHVSEHPSSRLGNFCRPLCLACQPLSDHHGKQDLSAQFSS